jgi:hypothetical protein
MRFAPVVVIGATFFLITAGILIKGAVAEKTVQ